MRFSINFSHSFKKKPILHKQLSKVLLFFTLSFLISCAGKQSATKIEKPPFIPLTKRKIFLAYLINYTQQFQLDIKIRTALIKYFNNYSQFQIMPEESFEDSNLYMVIHINSFYLIPITKKFENAEPVNSRFYAEFNITTQTKPENNVKPTVYLDNERIKISAYFQVNEENPLQTYAVKEAEFLQYIGYYIDYLLLTGDKLPDPEPGKTTFFSPGSLPTSPLPGAGLTPTQIAPDFKPNSPLNSENLGSPLNLGPPAESEKPKETKPRSAVDPAIPIIDE